MAETGKQQHARVPISRTNLRITPDSRRVLIKAFAPGDDRRCRSLVERILKLDTAQVANGLRTVLKEFDDRHMDLSAVLSQRYEQVAYLLPAGAEPTYDQSMLIGAYFMSEYALESAALFNPSIVPHPDQSGIAEKSLRVVMSLRATGEGHISSIEFRNGLVDAGGNLSIDPPLSHVANPLKVDNPRYSKPTFHKKLGGLRLRDEFAARVMELLGDEFTLGELRAAIRKLESRTHAWGREEHEDARLILWLAECTYEIHFGENIPLSGRVLFPHSPTEMEGIEDARFVQFTEDDGEKSYFATYTAWDGQNMLPQLIETIDFSHFRLSTLSGPAVRNKGMALFPRRIDGKFTMIGREDDENLFLLQSDDVHVWKDARLLARPEQPWEFVKMGNCGSPLETEAGWLVITHGVGAMRRYCIGAMLLDLDDPTKVIGRLPDPLIEPDENEREGYVPNVVYTCGALIHRDHLILPYAMSDYATTVAKVKLADLLGALT